ncbi:MAG: hypothetical protein Ct9H300mP1_04600 [Planctomycetaceae bacterium]|nr:MAG: hypothetical protein Ct9H300mP1_04600 [Planctomycetaceae bacterium]
MTSPARSTAEIIPVLDLMRGRVGFVASPANGNHTSRSPAGWPTRPIRSKSPHAFAGQLGLDRIYLADLDAIENNQPAWNEIERLTGAGHRLMVDAGLRGRRSSP